MSNSERITGGADYLSTVELLNWNVADRPMGLLHRIEGDRAAIAAGIEVGYYETPRQATHADVAAVMECAPSTASEHFRKAESKLLTALFERHTGV